MVEEGGKNVFVDLTTNCSTQQELETGLEGSIREVFKKASVKVMEQWLKRMDKCVEVQGDKVEI